ncbi:MAG: SDR family oxidoreductase, partial [Steroidobacteraceae bacterium]|nr:SDR family oxidoreductase [Steroidobacteraceae bacterium]
GAIGDATAPAHGVAARDELEATAAAIRQSSGAPVATFTGDMRNEADVAALLRHAVATFGRLDIVINNAGVGYLFGSLLETTQERWDTVHHVNLRGPFFAIKHAGLLMREQPEHPGWGRGRIINIASKAAKSASLYTGAYTASKHGLIGLTRAAAVELGPLGINVNAVCPNHVTTGLGLWQNEFMAGRRGLSVDDYLQAMRARIPLGRVGLPDDTANACAFLCSAQAVYITGEALNVSGGEEYH